MSDTEAPAAAPAAPAQPMQPAIRTSDGPLGDLFAALSAAHGEMTDPTKNKTARVAMKNGGDYSYKYSDLADLLKMARPVLAKYGLAIFQAATTPVYGAVRVTTRILHGSGQWIESELMMAVGDDKPQTLGSMITYARRYAAGGALGVSPDEDEDGNIGQQADRAPPQRQQAQRARPAPQRAPDEAEVTQGARSAADAAARAPAPATKGPSTYDNKNPQMVVRLNNILKAQKVPEEVWPAVGARLDGRLSTDLKALVELMRSEVPT